jgi:hypothetical protein
MLLDSNPKPVKEPIKMHLKITRNPLCQNGLSRKKQ